MLTLLLNCPSGLIPRLRRVVRRVVWKSSVDICSRSSRGRSILLTTVNYRLADDVCSNPKTFRIFSPDELVSNKLFAVLEAPNSGRNFQWDIASRNKGGRVVEILSEHTCQGMLQGYTLTGRTGLFPSYEAFLGIVGTMCAQYAKFVKMVSSPRRSLRLPLNSVSGS